jgi:hypothetical protein
MPLQVCTNAGVVPTEGLGWDGLHMHIEMGAPDIAHAGVLHLGGEEGLLIDSLHGWRRGERPTGGGRVLAEGMEFAGGR